MVLLPIGVANRNCGGVGRDDGRCIVARGGRDGREGGSALLFTGFWLGEGGIARPKRGVLGPPLLRLGPGTGSLKRGAGDGVVDVPAGVGVSTGLVLSGMSSILGSVGGYEDWDSFMSSRFAAPRRYVKRESRYAMTRCLLVESMNTALVMRVLQRDVFTKSPSDHYQLLRFVRVF